jgi:hypothetical protein
MKKIAFAVCAAAMMGAAGKAQAIVFTWNGNSNVSGQTLDVSADFTAVGNVLTIVLTNNSPQASNNPADTLGTLLWDLPGVTFLQPDAGNNVSLAGSSSVTLNNQPYTDPYDLNKEYMYNNNVTLQSVNFGHGVSSVGIGVFSTNNDTFYERMKGLGDAGSAPGDAFSICSPFGTSGAANNNPAVNNSLMFTLVGNGPIDVNSISNVAFSFGSGAQTTSIVPEPASLAALGIGALALLRRRRKA